MKCVTQAFVSCKKELVRLSNFKVCDKINRGKQGIDRKNIFFKHQENRLFLIHGHKWEGNTWVTPQIVVVFFCPNMWPKICLELWSTKLFVEEMMRDFVGLILVLQGAVERHDFG